jgi:peptide/nickel transport system permease protein
MSGPAIANVTFDSREEEDFDAAVARGLAAGRGARWERLKRHPSLFLGGGILAAFVIVAVLGVIESGRTLATIAQNLAYAESSSVPGPSPAHPFGIMRGIGIDVFHALWQGTPFDLALVGGVILLALGVGVFLGAYAGYRGGPGDTLITDTGDVIVGVPPFFLVMVLFVGVHLLIRPDQYLLVFGFCFAFVLWPYYARPVRARAQQVSREAYVEAAKASGAPGRRIIVGHILPNSFYPALAQVPVDVYNIFFVLTVFEFIGCYGGGANGFYSTLTPFPTNVFPEWGYLLAAGACYGYDLINPLANWWMFVFPALVIVVFGIGVMLLCDGGEKYLDVRRSG